MKGRLSKIALCLPLLFLDIDVNVNALPDAELIGDYGRILPGWGWRLKFTTADASQQCEMNQGCYVVVGPSPDPWDDWGWGGGWEPDPCSWSCDDYGDSGGGGGSGGTPNQDNQVLSAAEITNLTASIYQIIDGLKAQLAIAGVPDSVRSEILGKIDLLGKVVTYVNSTVQVSNHLINAEFGYAYVEVAALAVSLGVATSLASVPTIAAALSVIAAYAVSSYGKDLYDIAKEYVVGKINEYNNSNGGSSGGGNNLPEYPDPRDYYCWQVGMPRLICMNIP